MSDSPARNVEPDLSAGNIDLLLAFNLNRTYNYLAPLLDRGLRELQMTGSQLNVLLVLSGEPDGLALSEIGRRLVVSKANVTGLIDRLESKKLLIRGSSDDRRVIKALLTDEGRELIEIAFPLHRDQLARCWSCLSPQEKKELIALLTKMRRGMRESCKVHAV